MYGGRPRRSGRSSPDLDSQYETTNTIRTINRTNGKNILRPNELPSIAMILTTLANYASRIARVTIGATLSDRLLDSPEDFHKDKDLMFTANMTILNFWPKQ